MLAVTVLALVVLVAALAGGLALPARRPHERAPGEGVATAISLGVALLAIAVAVVVIAVVAIVLV